MARTEEAQPPEYYNPADYLYKKKTMPAVQQGSSDAAAAFVPEPRISDSSAGSNDTMPSLVSYDDDNDSGVDASASVSPEPPMETGDNFALPVINVEEKDFPSEDRKVYNMKFDFNVMTLSITFIIR